MQIPDSRSDSFSQTDREAAFGFVVVRRSVTRRLEDLCSASSLSRGKIITLSPLTVIFLEAAYTDITVYYKVAFTPSDMLHYS